MKILVYLAMLMALSACGRKEQPVILAGTTVFQNPLDLDVDEDYCEDELSERFNYVGAGLKVQLLDECLDRRGYRIMFNMI